MNTESIKLVEWHIAKLKEIRGLQRLLDYEEKRALRSLPRALKRDFEELGADLIYADGPDTKGTIEYRRKLVNLMTEIFELL